MLRPISLGAFIAISLVAFLSLAYSLYKRFLLLEKAKRVNLFNQWWKRIKGVITYALFQKKMVWDPYAGLYHILIFWGFIILLYRSLTLIGEGLSIHLPGIHHPAYLLMKDFFEVLVLVGVLLALIRRLFIRPWRLRNSLDAFLTLGFIALLMVSDLFADASFIAETSPAWMAFAPFSTALSTLIHPQKALFLYKLFWWIHILTLYSFANFLPYSKHFHVYTSLFNVFFQPLSSPGRLTPMDLENVDETSTFGVEKITDFNWKQILDLYTCTECGRCVEFCPTTLTDKPLIPRDFTVGLRDAGYRDTPKLLLEETDGQGGALTTLHGDIMDPEVYWACTTCRWCEHACPLMISYVDKMVELRRHAVLERSEFPSEIQEAFRGMEVQGNPWNLPKDGRTDWMQDLDVPILKDKGSCDWLFWVGCAGSYDDHGKKVSRALVKLLQSGGVDFAILGQEETCTGDSARRMGNEYLFQMLAQENIETLNRYKVKKIVTPCPHCMNTLRHEYPDFGGSFEVWHATELVADLISRGRLALTKTVDREITFHDPCYLGRYQGQYAAPRFILNHIPGLTVKEMKNSREKAICCGAGGGRMWMEEKLGTRINHRRFQDVMETGVSQLCVSCPFCFVMLDNAAREKESDTSTSDALELAALAVE